MLGLGLRLSRVEARSSILPLHSRIVFLGDSIIANRGLFGFADWSLFFSGGRYYPRLLGAGPTGWNQGVSGNTTTQMIARIANVTAESPKVVVVLAGTNDIGTGANTAAQIKTNLRSIIDTCKGASAKVVMLTILPRASVGWNASMETDRGAVNTWIKQQGDIIPVDMDLVITDTGTQLQSDATHPNAIGAQAMGTAVGAVLASLISSTSILYTAPTAPAENLYANPFFTGGTTVATSWSSFGAVDGCTHTFSKQTFDGTAQQLAFSGTATSAVASNVNQNVTPAGGLTGNLFEAWVEVNITDFTGLGGFSLSAGTNSNNNCAMSVVSQFSGTGLAPCSGVLRCPPSVLASDGGTLGSRLAVIPNASGSVTGTVQWSRAGYRKVPTGQ